MKSAFLTTLSILIGLPFIASGVFLMFFEMPVLGGVLAFMGVLFIYAMAPAFAETRLNAQTDQALRKIAKNVAKATRPEPEGVHWVWWVLAVIAVPALVGIPALIVIAVVHTGRKNRALMRKLA